MTPTPFGALLKEKYTSVDASCIPSRHGDIMLPASTLSNKEEAFLTLAVKMAEVSEVEYQHGAVVVKGGRVVSLGVNKWRNPHGTVGDDMSFDPTITVHAEMDALSRVVDPSGCVVYVARVNRNGKRKFSRPCVRCMKSLSEMGVKRVVYTMEETN